ncbi:hypothetical protein BV25DRAFT_1803095 [Artomyces pyxidatus]|uniref:Uncharacterized protein n=1 Tax=Artomyces pyxidatus TaxID=48021 RepID=A0ACB8T2K0_9AGAM|nr:hypothetical protein BV25DRAFT_1803095 [Artomyces pyxidatus]
MGRRRPLLGLDTSSTQASVSRRNYGATESPQIPAVSRSPETYRQSHPLENVPEEGIVDLDEFDEEVLEQQGLYTGSYNRLVLLYTIVPATSLVLWILLAFVPPFIWHTLPTPHSTPFPELLLSISLWALSHLLSVPLFTFTSAFLQPVLACTISTAAHVLLRTALRVAALPLLALRHAMDYPSATFRDAAFRRVWWLALGWSLAEVAVGVAQGYEQLALYRDVLVPESDVRELVRLWARPRGKSVSASPPGHVRDEQLRESLSRGEEGRPRNQPRKPSNAEIRLEVDRDLDQLVALKAREELEELYGFPAIRIPVFVSCLLRFASIMLSLGFTLLLSAAYLSVPLSLNAAYIPPSKTNGPFIITFILVFFIHLLLSLLHTPMFLSRIGVHVVAYVGFLVGLGSVFAGLGLWDALS